MAIPGEYGSPFSLDLIQLSMGTRERYKISNQIEYISGIHTPWHDTSVVFCKYTYTCALALIIGRVQMKLTELAS